MSHIFTGDTVRVKGTFTDYAPEGETGDLVDPDSNAATVKIYNAEMRQIASAASTRESAGVYYYDWTVPATEGTYYVEFYGLFLTKPQITRKKVKVKFKPDTV